MSEPNRLDATVFVFRDKEFKKIVATYIERSKDFFSNKERYEHVATLEPRRFIECYYDTVMKSQVMGSMKFD